MPPFILDARGRELFSLTFYAFLLFSNIYIHFFQKTPCFDVPPPGFSGPSHPLAPPLHATGWNWEQAPFGRCLRSTGSHHESSTSFGSSRLNRFQLPDIITYLMN